MLLLSFVPALNPPELSWQKRFRPPFGREPMRYGLPLRGNDTFQNTPTKQALKMKPARAAVHTISAGIISKIYIHCNTISTVLRSATVECDDVAVG
jgi:hypothetical protein